MRLKSSGHFVVLDGLRGVAALAVLCLHASYKIGFHSFPARAYLAVDFFFLLSGFVIAKSYENRLRTTMTFGKFVRLRLIRLYPLIALGTLLGAIGVASHLQLVHRAGDAAGSLMTWQNLAASLVLGLLILPFGPLSPKTMPLDEPLWSIMFEIIINLVYARFIRLFSNRFVILIIAASAALLAWSLEQNNDQLGGDVDSLLLPAFIRVTLSFFLGVMLYRLFDRGDFAKLPRISPLLLAVILLASFMPRYGFRFQWVYDFACILLLYPAIIIAGASDGLNAALSPRWLPLAAWSGRLSFPIYALHKPLIDHLSHLQHLDRPMRVALLVLTTLSVIMISAGATLLYDEPLRRWLTRKTTQNQRVLVR